MTVGTVQWFLLGVAVLHALFMALELFPWRTPFLLERASRKLPKDEAFTVSQRDLVATVVHNAGIYNGILAAGLSWAALTGESANDVARVLLAGAAVAGLFGTATMRSVPTAVQAVLGIIGLLML